MQFLDDSLYPENQQPLVIQAAPYGPQYLPEDSDDIPVRMDEQVQKAVDCWNAGATVLHVHVREDDGKGSKRLSKFNEMLARLREAVPDMLLQVGGSISFAPEGEGAQAKWLDHDTRHMLADLSPKPDQVTIAINSSQMNITEMLTADDIRGTLLEKPEYFKAYTNMVQNVHQMDDSSSGKPAPLTDSRTLMRGLQVMDAILAAPDVGVRIADVCRSTGLERATVYRLLAALQASNYVEQAGRYRYAPGGRWQGFVPSAKRREDLAGRLAPVLADVSNSCGDASFAVVRQGALSRCIARHVGTFPVQVLVIEVGTKQPLGVGAAGLALLAALPDREIESVIETNDDALPLYGNMTSAKLRALVLATRERGWSVIGNHATRGVLAVGRPVYGADDQILAGVSFATTEGRMPLARQRTISRLIREALISHGLNSH